MKQNYGTLFCTKDVAQPWTVTAGEAFMQMFDDAPRKRSRQEANIKVEEEQTHSETDSGSSDAEPGSRETVGARKAEEIVFESGR
jgi:hypothetical protein